MAVRHSFRYGIDEVGAVRRVKFVIQLSSDDSWHLFGVVEGTGPEEFTVPPQWPGQVFEHSDIAFPQAFDDVGEEGIDALYEIGMLAGRKREGIT